MAYPHDYMHLYYCRQRKVTGSFIMDRKEERRDRFDRKKKFKKLTRSSKAKTERKKNKRKGDDSTIYGHAVEH